MLQTRKRALNGLFDIMPVSRGLQDVAQGSVVDEETVVLLVASLGGDFRQVGEDGILLEDGMVVCQGRREDAWCGEPDQCIYQHRSCIRGRGL